ncbi:hypothetical protein GE061_007534 [Apolygus lucorum]|uniref:Uncharacterized protein n=1 Tax=Apolygus lucorum TaxID=248454 RepID=A0A6A4IHV3_APOLU|nr:hypothetical protein GE061_007534 [Apolygus lucorum]
MRLMWGWERDKYATLSTVYELKKRRGRCLLTTIFRGGSTPDVRKDARRDARRTASVSQVVGRVGRTALQLLLPRVTGGGVSDVGSPPRDERPDDEDASSLGVPGKPVDGGFNPRWLPIRGSGTRKRIGHGFHIIYYKRVRLKSFSHIVEDLDNNNKALGV